VSFGAGIAAYAAAPVAALGIRGGCRKRLPQFSRPSRGVKFSRIVSGSGDIKD